MNQNINRRSFFSQSTLGLTALGITVLGRPLQAETPVLARIAETPVDHPLRPALKIAEDCLKKMDSVSDYTAVFHKKEQVGKKSVEARMVMKFREEPFGVYLKFLEPSAGREVLYVKGQNRDRMLVKDVGFASLAGTVALDPTGSYAMDENRYPVTNIGLRILVTKLIETWLNDMTLAGVKVNQTADTDVGSMKCMLVDVTHTQRHPSAKFQTTRLYVDNATGFPVRVQAFDFPSRRENSAPLVEDYHYANLRVNVGLTDADFSTQNPGYRF